MDIADTIRAEARENDHTPGIWTLVNGEMWCYCETCGEGAVVVGDECRLDNMQDRCQIQTAATHWKDGEETT